MGGLPTDLVSDAGAQSVAPIGVPQKDKPKRRRPSVGGKTRLVAGLVLGLVVVAGLWMIFGHSESKSDQYLAALDDAGLRDNFAADRAALTAAKGVCDELDGGGEPQGSEADQIAVEQFCPDYADRFKILEVEDIDGTFTIIDGDSAGYDIGGTCQGEGGYGDLNSSTQVVVTNTDGDELVRTALGPGTTDSIIDCKFEFTFELTEGEETYIVAVGDRGEFNYTWEEVSRPGAIALSIG